MKSSRSRFSRRHLLAVCTFLVPLAVLAILGQNELSRQGDQIQAGISSRASLYLESAALALEQQVDRHLPDLLKDSRTLLGEVEPVRAALQLREQERYAALLDILVLDEQGSLVWPRLPPATMSLAFARDPRGRLPETAVSQSLNAADLLLTTGNFEAAERLLLFLVDKMEKAGDEARTVYVLARFRLATVQHRLGQDEAAREGFHYVVGRAEGRSPRTHDSNGLLAETVLAEMGSSQDRIDLLHRIANNSRYSDYADPLLTAVVERVADGIGDDDEKHDEATLLVSEARQRAQTRTFAGDYDSILKSELLLSLRQRPVADQPSADIQIVATLGQATTMLWVRDATAEEGERFPRAARIALHLDLGLLMAPALDPFIATEGSFVLAIHDPRDIALVEPPETVPADYVPPTRDVRGLKLSVYPANADRLLAEADARSRNRLLLLSALFAAAMVGALWLWRSVSREAELAALKVDLVSRVSHELKTPLALIRMYGETLQLGRARDSEQVQHFGGIVARESERLTTMIQRILDFSRQQAGTLTYSPATIELDALLQRICDAYTPHLESRGAMLSDMVHAQATVQCDENACESAIVNLLENAAKYAIEGDDDHEIEVDLVVERGTATVEVRDRGRGIPENESDQVFDPFYRATNSGEVRGAGIGLSLVRHFAQSHGGDVTAHAREGGGTVFRLVLPLANSLNAGMKTES